jgi:hypothetical protein
VVSVRLDDAVEPDGEVAGPWPGPLDGCGDELGPVEGLEDGLDACGVGAMPGGTGSSPPCHDIATYPPAGAFRELAPSDEYVHFPDVPLDHHKDQ